ncbi:hypothetical protein KUTeg_004800 [Tegillarca granosa]|uniref:Poly [ADP-ribose] polymerase n=1 Tax=Tegillarca granosa TaxID=220873 RepID=A0ABQ9FHX3_TEGGR|nr:hypothetical protein KUTeg_004800 [Tegillarca granosa]
MGTGKLGYPAYIAANTMFQCIDKYLTQNKTTSIRQVNIVIYPKDAGTLKAFESAEEVYNSNSYSQHERKTMKYPHSSTASSSEHGSHLQEPPQTKIGHLMVSIVIGDITKEVSHVIVNSTMDPRDLSKGAVSKAILKAAGSQIQDECLQKGKFFTSDKPLVTSGGYMNCRVIFHVKSQKEADEWEKVVSMCLFEAERRRFSSISFPALGTGGLGCSPDDVAKAMFKAIRNFSPEPQHLKHIRIVVFQENMMDRFIAGLDKKESEGIFAKVKVAAGKVKDKIAQGNAFLININYKAKKKLEDSYNNEFSEKTLSGVYKDAITNLTEKQVNISSVRSFLYFCIMVFPVNDIQRYYFSHINGLQLHYQEDKAEIEKICQKYHVTVKTNRQKGLIELCGRKNNVADAHSSISDYIHGEDKKKDTYDKGKAISKYVQWYYEDNNKKMKMFSPNMNYELEIAHSRKEQKCYVKDNKGASYMVDFKKMEETVLSQPGIKLKVERRETNSGAKSEKLPLPKTWLPMKQDENLKVITLQPGDREYEKVKSEFTKSAQAHRNIIKINRIQNKFLYQQYAAKRAELKLKNQGKNPERWLWHGTSPDTLTKINHNGFNRSYCGKNGTMYGQGVYFAVNASYSLRYCVADGKGQYHMYAVQVLTGDCCQGSK